MPTAQQNTIWQSKVWTTLRAGYGVEDVAVMLKCNVDDVRREVQIAREEGTIKTRLRVKKPPTVEAGGRCQR